MSRKVTNVGRDADGNIEYLCNPGKHWSPISAKKAIRHIENGDHEYETRVWGESSAELHVREFEDEKYLSTNPDDSEYNNLNNLEKCDNCNCV